MMFTLKITFPGLFVLIFYISVNKFSVMMGGFPAFLGRTSTKLQKKCPFCDSVGSDTLPLDLVSHPVTHFTHSYISRFPNPYPSLYPPRDKCPFSRVISTASVMSPP